MTLRHQALLFIAGFPALLSSCALVGKSPRIESDRREVTSGEAWSERFTVSGTARSNPGRFSDAVVIQPDWANRRENPWFTWQEGHFVQKLETGKRYRFDLREDFRRVNQTEATYRSIEVERISSPDGKVLLDASVCPIHHASMHWESENSGSMEAYYQTPFFKWRGTQFPHDGYAYLACGSGYYVAKRWICPECREHSDRAVKRLGIDRY